MLRVSGVLNLNVSRFLKARPAAFKVRVINDGKVFDEVVEIDVVKKTATFHVPSAEEMDEANVIHDFRKVSRCPVSSAVHWVSFLFLIRTL